MAKVAKKSGAAQGGASATSKLSSLQQISAAGVNKWCLVIGLLYFVQAAVILVLGNQYALPVTTSFLTVDTLASRNGGYVLANATRHLFDIRISYLVAAFLLVAAAFYLAMALIYRQQFEAGLKAKRNPGRWLKYAVAGSLMMVTVAMLSGVADISTLIMVITLDAIFCLLGMVMEARLSGKQTTRKLEELISAKAVLVPWLVVAIYAVGARVYGSAHVPNYVYGIYASMLVLSLVWGAVAKKHKQAQGPWSNYLYGETLLLIIGFVASSALAWQVFIGALRP